jgi:hypothetical protein
MSSALLKFATWLLQKLAAGALIVLLALAGYGVWLYLQEEGILERERVAKLQRALVERDQLLAAQAAVEKKLAGIRTEIEGQKQRARKAAEIMAQLRQLESWWDRIFGNRDQQSANVDQIKRMEELKSEAGAKLGELQALVTRTVWEKDGLEGALRRANAEVASLEIGQSQPRRYIISAWETTKWWIAIALVSYFFGPTLWALMMYYGVARLMIRGRAIRLGEDPAALPELGESRVSIEATLRRGEVLRVKEKFLQASDEGLAKSTRFVLDWRIPLTSLACGLVELVEMRHSAADTGDAVYRVTLSNGDDPHIELATVGVPAGGSLVLRPSFLAGVIQREGDTLAIRRHWRIFRWQAWITGQFRFFEFVGPCRLVVAGSRGVRAERLIDREGQLGPARRTNQDATIGFTPNLEYRPVRAETFWSYYRGMNPLFDDLFAGKGLFVLQETASEGAAAKAGRFWSGVWSGVLKVFGL